MPLSVKSSTEFDSTFKRIDKLLNSSDAIRLKYKRYLKALYDLCGFSGLPELTINGFDYEQIWSQLELQNNKADDHLIKDVANLLTSCSSSSLQDVTDENETAVADDDGAVEDAEEIIETQNDIGPPEISAEPVPKLSDALPYNSEVDDNFFKLCQLEEFLLLENEENDDDIEETGEMENLSDTSEHAMYGDFFDPPAVSMDSDQIPSKFQEEQAKLGDEIQELETANIGEKKWTMKGEISGQGREKDSLLSEFVQFEHQSRLPPVITEETTRTLEDIIKQRIKDKVFDDVERKVRPHEGPQEYKKKVILGQENTKKSLAEVYEEEFQKQQEGASKKEDPKHEEIKTKMESLFKQLDALSHSHFTPRPAQPEMRVVKNVPSIAMEDVTPGTSSTSQALAPEEIHTKASLPKGETELDKTDKLRARRKKKSKQKLKRKEKEKRQKIADKLNPGLGNKYSKQKILRDLEKSGGSVTVIGGKRRGKGSKNFMGELQDVVEQAKTRKRRTLKKDTKELEAKKFKL